PHIELYPTQRDNQVNYPGKYLFSITGTEAKDWVPAYINWLTIIFYAISLILLVVLIVRYCHLLARNGYFLLSAVFLATSLFTIRLVMIMREFPFKVIHISIFDPVNFTEGAINPSLGDLLLNLTSLLIVILFIQNGLKYSILFKKFLTNKSLILRGVVIAVYTFLSLVSFRFIYDNIRNILTNSQIEMDINASIAFDELRVTATLIFFISCLIFFFVQYLNLKLIKRLANRSVVTLIISLLVALVAFYYYDSTYFGFFLVLMGAFWFIASYFRVIRYLGMVRYLTFLYLFLAAIVTSVSGGFAIYKQFEFDEETEKNKFANNLLLERDIMGEYLLFQMIDRIKKNDYLATRLYNDKLAENKIAETINKQYLVDYFDRYHGQVHLFNSEGEAFMQNETQLSLDEFLEEKIGENGQTDYENIYYVRNTGVQDRYYVKVPIERFKRLLGTIVMELTLKRYVSRSVYSELLVENKYSGAGSTKFDYAYYEGDKVLMKVGNFNFKRNFNPAYFDQEEIFNSGLEIDGYHHLGVKTKSGKKIVITSRQYNTNNILSNFSFLFLIQVLGIACIIFVYRAMASSYRGKFYFSTKIQLYLGAAFFVPLLIVSVAILNSLNISYKEEINNSYQKSASRIEENINLLLEQFFDGKLNENAVSLKLSTISDLVQNEVYIYDTRGNLVVISQPQIYDLEILSDKINPVALMEVIYNNKERVVLNESIGKLDYKTTYLAIKDTNTNELIGLMGMPFFESKNHLIRQQIEVFTSLINIFILIFIVSLIVSYFAVKILTDPLKLLTQKIKKTSFSDLNQPLEYESKDEIGILVDEYNQMLRKFEDSKVALARSEKEAAWKTIAQQVAHEIKNPLTPMKLTLQQMQRVIDADDRSHRAINNLLHQVDTLSDIATSFSAFAKMPIPESEPFDIIAVLKESTQLFENEEGQIETDFAVDELIVMGDRKLTGRIFNNLVINALQSVPSDRTPEVIVKLDRSETKAKITISDNGSGIPEEFHNKIFIPNFTTKVKGSGIGLAISKRGIEHAGGSIWFESSEDGTTFYIEWPVPETNDI
ncbi:MAG: HAMP domain-containing sensor histidine kinase, partial [Cyclobacteriaceae bacterium]